MNEKKSVHKYPIPRVSAKKSMSDLDEPRRERLLSATFTEARHRKRWKPSSSESSAEELRPASEDELKAASEEEEERHRKRRKLSASAEEHKKAAEEHKKRRKPAALKQRVRFDFEALAPSAGVALLRSRFESPSPYLRSLRGMDAADVVIDPAWQFGLLTKRDGALGLDGGHHALVEHLGQYSLEDAKRYYDERHVASKGESPAHGQLLRLPAEGALAADPATLLLRHSLAFYPVYYELEEDDAEESAVKVVAVALDKGERRKYCWEHHLQSHNAFYVGVLQVLPFGFIFSFTFRFRFRFSLSFCFSFSFCFSLSLSNSSSLSLSNSLSEKTKALPWKRRAWRWSSRRASRRCGPSWGWWTRWSGTCGRGTTWAALSASSGTAGRTRRGRGTAACTPRCERGRS